MKACMHGEDGKAQARVSRSGADGGRESEGRLRASPGTLQLGRRGAVIDQQTANTKTAGKAPPRHRSYESGTGRQASTAKAKAASGRPVKGGNGAGNKGTSISET